MILQKKLIRCLSKNFSPTSKIAQNVFDEKGQIGLKIIDR